MHVLGIRHHGPGSARRLLRALHALSPDCLLIEMPSDVEMSLSYAGNEKMKPPVALLVYNPKNFNQASYFPFATFSPEWQALQYGIKNGVPVRPIDLPLNLSFALRDTSLGEIRPDLEALPSGEDLRVRQDPLGLIAELAGYSDSERWWEITFEQEDEDLAVFEGITDLVGALRTELQRRESGETLLREAHMRVMIRKVQGEGFKRIVAVCGAWHAPALKDVGRIAPASDHKLLRGLKKIKTASTWIPWSYHRLSRQAGYGAGVISPAWYDLLFHRRGEVTIRWMGRAARLLRKEELEASPAQTLEAVRLAEALAALRRRAIPGLEELEESALTVLCNGDLQKMNLIRDKLIIGDKLGRVPPEIPVVPLQKDLEKEIRSARLRKESQTVELIRKSLDLRKEGNRLASLLLHRLNVLAIPWGNLRKGSQFRTGSFSEEWSLRWKPDFAIRIIEASPLGNTVCEAAVHALMKKAAGSRDLTDLAGQVWDALRADLRDAVDPLILKMSDMAALTKDSYHLLQALPPLVNIISYGDARQTDTEAVEQLIDEIIPRICIGLPGACMHIEAEAAKELFREIRAVNHAVNLLDNPSHLDEWQSTLQSIASQPGIHVLLRGAALRLLFDKGHVSAEKAGIQLYFFLSRSENANDAAQWLEGFMHGSGLLLLHNPALWTIIDEWIDHLEMDAFQEILPILRRIFSVYSQAERRKMLELAHMGRESVIRMEEKPDRWNEGRAEKVMPVLKMILGL